ncbi:MAG: PqqD family protein [Oscillospiraceae bacterium]|nr:PqqD family protein [Oscillospiraceae bacterium]MDD4414251.1 PqqD family protein [Oscillospiraceae bacterium]
MKIMSGYMLREVGGESIVVPVGSRTVDLRGIIKLNGTAAFLWKMLQDDCTCQELITAMLDEYDVDEETAEKDVKRFIESLEQNNLLEKSSGKADN